MKVLRIDLQTEDRSIFKDEEDLRKSLIENGDAKVKQEDETLKVFSCDGLEEIKQ